MTSATPTSTPGTYQFDLTGVTAGKSVTVNFVPGGVTYGGVANVVQAPATASLNGQAYLDIQFNTYGSNINPSTLVGREFTLGGAGAGVVVDGAPLLMSTTSTDQVYRYFLSPAPGTTVVFPNNGTVTINFNAGSWADENGNLNVASSDQFQLITTGTPGQTDTTQTAFFISILGDVRLDDPTGFISGTNPLVDITGTAMITFSAQNNSPVFTLDASGTMSIYRIGNIASGAAHFVVNMAPLADNPPQPPLIYGAIAIDTNLGFLKSLDITANVQALLELNLTASIQTVKLTLAGIPGDTIFDSYSSTLMSNLSSLGTSIFGSTPLPQAWISAFTAGGITLASSAVRGAYADRQRPARRLDRPRRRQRPAVFHLLRGGQRRRQHRGAHRGRQRSPHADSPAVHVHVAVGRRIEPCRSDELQPRRRALVHPGRRH